jgi:hypothetical protein
VEYLKVPEEDRGNFLKQQADAMRPYHQGLLREGKIHAWYLYEVRFPFGESTPYDHVIVTVFTDPDAQAEREQSITHRAYRVGSDGAKPTAFRSPDYQTMESSYATINFLRVPEEAQTAFPDQMRLSGKPLFDQYVGAGQWKTWGLFERVGEPSFEPYDFVVVTRHASFANAEVPIPLAGTNRGQRPAEDSPRLVKAQLWKLLDIVLPAE